VSYWETVENLKLTLNYYESSIHVERCLSPRHKFKSRSGEKHHFMVVFNVFVLELDQGLPEDILHAGPHAG
jgi:hypothetical protein